MNGIIPPAAIPDIAALAAIVQGLKSPKVALQILDLDARVKALGTEKVAIIKANEALVKRQEQMDKALQKQEDQAVALHLREKAIEDAEAQVKTMMSQSQRRVAEQRVESEALHEKNITRAEELDEREESIDEKEIRAENNLSTAKALKDERTAALEKTKKALEAASQ